MDHDYAAAQTRRTFDKLGDEPMGAFRDPDSIESLSARLFDAIHNRGAMNAAVERKMRDAASETFRDYEPAVNQRSVKRAGPMEDLILAIDQKTTGMHEVANKLERHADAVHGPTDDNGKVGVAPSTDNDNLGALTRIWMALDRLDNALHRVALQAGRNTTLAE